MLIAPATEESGSATVASPRAGAASAAGASPRTGAAGSAPLVVLDGGAAVARLHALVARSMARIGARATAARLLVGRDDAAALAAIGELCELTRAALEDARRLVASLPAQACDEALADDVHDALGHSLSLAALLAGGARARVASEPALAREALARVAGLARESGDELAALLATPLGREPAPALQLFAADAYDQLPVAHAQLPARDAEPPLAPLTALAIDQPVTFAVDGEALAAAPRPVAEAAYRIVQESLTNARRHAPAAPVHVRVEAREGTLALAVVNAPARHAAGRSGSGRGIPGMCRRAAAAGGRLRAAATPGGGFRVEAHLPL